MGFPIKIWSKTCAKRGRKSNMEIRESFLWLIGNKWFLMTLIGAYQLSRASSILTGHRSSIKQFSIIKQFTIGKNDFRRNIHVISKGQLISTCLFGVFNFFKKRDKNKSTWGIRHHSRVECFRSFFGRIVGLKKSFRICLIFSMYIRGYRIF